MTGAAANAEDVTQEVFLSVMHDAARYDPARGTAKAWLCGIARNHAKRRLERDGRNLPLPDEIEDSNRAEGGAHGPGRGARADPAGARVATGDPGFATSV